MTDVTDFGARAGTETPMTAALQRAIDSAAEQGGGIVRFPSGEYLTGALTMRSGVTLRLEKGAVLRGSSAGEDYRQGNDMTYHHLIEGRDLHDIAIRGPGAIVGAGQHFRDKSKHRPKNLYFENCRNVLIEGIRLRSAGSWMQHYRFCQHVVIRGIDVFNHVSFNNDGLNIDSCRDVVIEDCRVDSDDDGIVLKSLSPTPCRDVTITRCTVSSHCNGLKMGTESGGGFIGVRIGDCKVASPKESKKIYGRQRGLAGLALEIVDGGTMDDLQVERVDIEGVSVPVFIRLGNRARRYGDAPAPGVGKLRNIVIRHLTARACSPIGCSITGLPGHCVENITLEDIDLGFEGGGRLEDAHRAIPEREKSYPESTMFGQLPAFGFYCRHVRNLRFRRLRLHTDQPDLRHALVFEDAEDVALEALQTPTASEGAALIRCADVRGLTLAHFTPAQTVPVLFELRGAATDDIIVEHSNLQRVQKTADIGAEVRSGALRTQ